MNDDDAARAHWLAAFDADMDRSDALYRDWLADQEGPE